MKEFGRKVGKLKLKAEQVKVKIGNVVNVIELGK